ncbi:hypothetical protein JTE90_024696 [Oedothorax gibbosus]|uniref:Uncharacterized protein n=1 Tax=Oedothorax gibbosus TaxID=931172 RepID=A0AAV6U9Z3_9ARAC|nr:hypothetical protein JTE90_024696 [Oedothorax gibbosus]
MSSLPSDDGSSRTTPPAFSALSPFAIEQDMSPRSGGSAPPKLIVTEARLCSPRKICRDMIFCKNSLNAHITTIKSQLEMLDNLGPNEVADREFFLIDLGNAKAFALSYRKKLESYRVCPIAGYKLSHAWNTDFQVLPSTSTSDMPPTPTSTLKALSPPATLASAHTRYFVEMSKNHAVVLFVDEDDAPGVVCTSWIAETNDCCIYPNVKTNEARDRYLKEIHTPEDNWAICRIKILKYYRKFEFALRNSKHAEETSHLESETEEEPVLYTKRKIRERHIVLPGEENSEAAPKRRRILEMRTSLPSLPPFPKPLIHHRSESPSPTRSSSQSLQDSSPGIHESGWRSPSVSTGASTQMLITQLKLLNSKIGYFMSDVSQALTELKSEVKWIKERLSGGSAAA